MQIRKTTKADAKELATMVSETIKQVNSTDHDESTILAWSGGNTPEAYVQMLGERIQYIAVEKETIIGLVDMLPDGEITSLYVHPNYLGKGIGKAMLAHIESIAIGMGVIKLHCQSSKNAKGFYEKHGYAFIKPDVWLFEGKPAMEVYVMEKKIITNTGL
jgi:putative acetyltransferase